MTDLFDEVQKVERVLRPYQADAIDAVRETVRQGVRRICLQAPTGSGKTMIAAKISALAREKKNKVAFVVDAISLVDQSVENFHKEGVQDIGVLQGDHYLTDMSQPMQVCSIQTIESRGFFPEAKIVFIDECHRLYTTHKKWIEHPDFKDTIFIGLSATPWSKGLGKYFDTLVVVSTIKEMIEQKYLSKFKVYASGHPDLKSVKTVRGDYHEGQLSEVMQESSLSADIVQSYREHWGKGRTLCFAVDKAHAKSLQERFNFAGIRCGYQDGDTAPDERRQIRRMFHDGSYEVVVNIDTLSTGTDWDVRCISLARPTKSEMKLVQIIGRGLRLAPPGADAKDELVILDHSDNTERLGFVSDIHHEYLDGSVRHPRRTKAVKREKLPIECKACTALHLPNKERKCPHCGHVNPLRSTLLEKEGRLAEVKRDGSMWQASKVKPVQWTVQECATFFAELKCYAEQHGYRPGWAAMKYREKTKNWPEPAIKHVRPARVVSPTVSMWIRSRQIAFAKSKRREEARANG